MYYSSLGNHSARTARRSQPAPHAEYGYSNDRRNGFLVPLAVVRTSPLELKTMVLSVEMFVHLQNHRGFYQHIIAQNIEKTGRPFPLDARIPYTSFDGLSFESLFNIKEFLEKDASLKVAGGLWYPTLHYLPNEDVATMNLYEVPYRFRAQPYGPAERTINTDVPHVVCPRCPMGPNLPLAPAGSWLQLPQERIIVSSGQRVLRIHMCGTCGQPVGRHWSAETDINLVVYFGEEILTMFGSFVDFEFQLVCQIASKLWMAALGGESTLPRNHQYTKTKREERQAAYNHWMEWEAIAAVRTWERRNIEREQGRPLSDAYGSDTS